MLAPPPVRSKSKPSKTFLGPASRKSLRNYQLPRLVVPVNPTRDHIAGPVKAPLTLVEYGDFQCPYCGAAYPEVKQVLAALKSKLRFVYRHFPMTNVHEYAMSAAEISEAAAAQGRFWEMHDFLFEHQDTINDSRQAFAFAESLGLDTGRMEIEIAQHVYQEDPGGFPRRSKKRSQWHTDILCKRGQARRRAGCRVPDRSFDLDLLIADFPPRPALCDVRLQYNVYAQSRPRLVILSVQPPVV